MGSCLGRRQSATLRRRRGDNRPAHNIGRSRTIATRAGCASTEVDANLSFNAAASVAEGRQIIDAYKGRAIGTNRVLTKPKSGRFARRRCSDARA